MDPQLVEVVEGERHVRRGRARECGLVTQSAGQIQLTVTPVTATALGRPAPADQMYHIWFGEPRLSHGS